MGSPMGAFLLTKRLLKGLGNPMASKTRIKPIIAICAPSKSEFTWRDLTDTNLQSFLIPSIIRTVSHDELEAWDVRLYLAFNSDDLFWQKHTPDLASTPWLSIHAIFVQAAANRVPLNHLT